MLVLYHLHDISSKRIQKQLPQRYITLKIDAAAALGCNFEPSTAEKPLNVPATISAKAAITNNVNNQQNKKNNFLPVFQYILQLFHPLTFH